MWVRLPPAVPVQGHGWSGCRALPPDPTECLVDSVYAADLAYLLGLYLGDGMLTLARRSVWRLRISLDVRYPGIIERCASAIEAICPGRVGATERPGCREIRADWKHWLCLFPQHAPGHKHLRPIEFPDWQRTLIRAQPEALIRGLIESDGCRVTNRVRARSGKTYEYPRYFFSNVSDDIRTLFIEVSSILGVQCRAVGPRNISVARRESVAKLDAVVPAKSASA